MQLSGYLLFTSACEQALAFYASCGLGQIAEMAGMARAVPRWRGHVLHARFEGPGVLFYASRMTMPNPCAGPRIC